MDLFDNVAFACSRIVTHRYSTSFSLGIRMLSKKFRDPVCAIYGFVRCADEIVDSFHEYDKATLLRNFKEEAFAAIRLGISLNPILQAFQKTVNTYRIDHELIHAFMHSMEADLYRKTYDEESYKTYIYGSAEVVGLMCLSIFCEGDKERYEKLKPYAQKLGAALQKVNFLRDMNSDFSERARIYFPGVDFERFNEDVKRKIEKDIVQDFREARVGIMKLPRGARTGVYLAYVYYKALFLKIRRTPAEELLERRIRVPDSQKITLLLASYFRIRLISAFLLPATS